MRPVEPPPTPWAFPPPTPADDDLIAIGADLEPGTLLAAYRSGLFPMPVGEAASGPIGWWSPDPRGILPLDRLRVSRSLRRSCRRYQVSFDTAFDAVIDTCRSLRTDGNWISTAIADAYRDLHRLGWAHSVEVWDGDDLVGGLYGVAIGALFAGESMFHRATDASKVALVALVDVLRRDVGPDALLDVQWSTEHLASLGVIEIPRTTYLARVAAAVARPVGLDLPAAPATGEYGAVRAAGSPALS